MILLYTGIFVKKMYDNSILFINDILDEQGFFMDINELNRMFSRNIGIMFYNSLKDAIPRKWRNNVRNSPLIDLNNEWYKMFVIC